MTGTTRGLGCVAIAIFAWARPTAAQSTPRDSVLALIQEFTRATNANDADLMSRVMTADGQFYMTRQDTNRFVVFRMTNVAYVERMRKPTTNTYLERTWNPLVTIEQRIAVVTVSYDYYTNKQFSHCGVNMFSLIRGDAGWQIAGIVYTVQPKGCSPSPLGPPVQ